jgi:hypothetical protein
VLLENLFSVICSSPPCLGSLILEFSSRWTCLLSCPTQLILFCLIECHCYNRLFMSLFLGFTNIVDFFSILSLYAPTLVVTKRGKNFQTASIPTRASQSHVRSSLGPSAETVAMEHQQCCFIRVILETSLTSEKRRNQREWEDCNSLCKSWARKPAHIHDICCQITTS